MPDSYVSFATVIVSPTHSCGRGYIKAVRTWWPVLWVCAASMAKQVKSIGVTLLLCLLLVLLASAAGKAEYEIYSNLCFIISSYAYWWIVVQKLHAKKPLGIPSAQGIIIFKLILWKLVLRSEIDLNSLGYGQIGYCGCDNNSGFLSEEFFQIWTAVNCWGKALNQVINYYQGCKWGRVVWSGAPVLFVARTHPGSSFKESGVKRRWNSLKASSVWVPPRKYKTWSTPL
jgi:hypothetical protein